MEIYNELDNIEIDVTNKEEINPLDLFDFSELYPNDKEEFGDPITYEVFIRG